MPVVRAVILRTWGSTPRETGADMMIRSHGGLLGTVGGGCGEAEVYELAQHLLVDSDAPSGAVLHVDLTENPEDGGGKVCGGRFDVLLHRLHPETDLPQVERVLEALENGRSLSWETDLGAVRPGFWKDGESKVELTPTLRVGELRAVQPELLKESGLFAEPVGLARRLVIVGAGHIARPLSAMASRLGYAVFVLDDRSQYARREYFPDAVQVVAGAYEKELPSLVQAPLTSVVLVTRGHKHDQDCLRLIVNESLEYLGMIGSQRRINAVFEELVEEGISPEKLASVRAPIGLEIGAQTPAEIAVSIVAEMIKQRRLGLQSGREAHSRRRRVAVQNRSV